MNRDQGDREWVSDEAHLATRLEDECPWESVSKVLAHEGWLDLVETIKTVSPDAYQALRRDLLKPAPSYFETAKTIVRGHHAG
jgi:hypothetical protein